MPAAIPPCHCPNAVPTFGVLRAGMKLIIQIPCYNEEQTLPLVLKDIPREIPGVDVIETQIVDDGCTDRTIDVAGSHGVHHIVRYVGHKGLAEAFKRGLAYALEQDADILVNTDGDNQYPSAEIPRLIEPIMTGEADIVVGDRKVPSNPHFSWLKRQLQRLGTRVTSCLAGEPVLDAASGFRAYSRQAMLEINIVSEFSYVLDTTVQASKKKLTMVHVPIDTNAPTRPSRLFRSLWEHVKRSAADLIRVYSLYEPFKIFLGLAVIFVLIGLYPLLRFMYFVFTDGGAGHIQSLIFGTIFFIIGFQFLGLGILGDHMRVNRKLIEEILTRIKQTKRDKRDR